MVEADDPKRVLTRLQTLYIGRPIGFEDAPSVLAGALATPKADYFAQYCCQWVIANHERLGGLVRELGLAFTMALFANCIDALIQR